jgi:hypothetical protein
VLRTRKTLVTGGGSATRGPCFGTAGFHFRMIRELSCPEQIAREHSVGGYGCPELHLPLPHIWWLTSCAGNRMSSTTGVVAAVCSCDTHLTLALRYGNWNTTELAALKSSARRSLFSFPRPYRW